jgi:acid stress-induced BolA-like protein IbaG/YrbA
MQMADVSKSHRIAATFNSLRYQKDPDGLYRLLRNMRTIETDGIRSVSRIYEDSRWVEVGEIVGNQHVSEDAQGLVVYIPADKEAQDFCFCSALAPDLVVWLTRDPLTYSREGVDGDMAPALGSVLVAELFAVDRILNHRGIISISVPCEEVSITEDVVSGQSSTLRSGNDHPTQSSTGPRRLFSNSLATTEEPLRTSALQAQFRSSVAGSPEQELVRSNDMARQIHVAIPTLSTVVAPDDAAYRRLLDRALQSARTGAFPTKGAFDTTGATTALSREGDRNGYDRYATGSALRSLNRLERDKKVGATGELYVQRIHALTLYVYTANHFDNTGVRITFQARPSLVGLVSRELAKHDQALCRDSPRL